MPQSKAIDKRTKYNCRIRGLHLQRPVTKGHVHQTSQSRGAVSQSKSTYHCICENSGLYKGWGNWPGGGGMAYIGCRGKPATRQPQLLHLLNNYHSNSEMKYTAIQYHNRTKPIDSEVKKKKRLVLQKINLKIILTQKNLKIYIIGCTK